MNDRNGTVVCPGTYDPVTNGHVDIITRTSNVFDKVVVGVVNNPVRKQTTLFTAEERKGFIEEATADLGNVEVQIFSTLLVEFARENGAGAIVKGMRAISDFEYEFEMAQLNRKLDPGIESIYVIASPHYCFLSSTGVARNGDLRGRCLRPRPGPGGGRPLGAPGRKVGFARDCSSSVGERLQKTRRITASSPNPPHTRRLTTR